MTSAIETINGVDYVRINLDGIDLTSATPVHKINAEQGVRQDSLAVRVLFPSVVMGPDNKDQLGESNSVIIFDVSRNGSNGQSNGHVHIQSATIVPHGRFIRTYGADTKGTYVETSIQQIAIGRHPVNEIRFTAVEGYSALIADAVAILKERAGPTPKP